MSRPLRLHVPGAFYHVTMRGNHRQDIFFAPADRTLFNELTEEVIERFSARLHAYCLMTNHVHLLIQVGDAPLGRLIMRIAGQYARIVQGQLRTTGHLFEKRYHPILVDADEYLLELLRYIHLNPVRARIVSTPDEYSWSSHHSYLGTRSEKWVTTEFALGMFHTELEHAVAAYRRFVTQEGSSTSPFGECNPNDQRILGSDDFAGKLLGAAWRPRSRQSIEELIEEAVRVFSVSLESLRSSSKQRHLTHARAWIAHRAVTLRITSLSHVARLLNRSESSLRECVRRQLPQ